MSLEQSVATVLERQTDRFYGKYRGLVLINVDPQNQGRIKAVVPEVLGIIPTNFCLPCTPYAGTLAGLFTVPMIGTGVWIEFEAGDVNRPIWTGCWWGTAQVPINELGLPSQFTSKVLRTDTGLMISLDDAVQSITFKDLAGSNTMSMQLGMVLVQGKAFMVLDAPLIFHGQAAIHPAVLGDQLLLYLNQMVLMFNTHVHPGELALGILPVVPVPPLPQMLPATPALISFKNFVE
ncbi:MAG: phage baseplate assembly protein V [Acidobacteriia bacterium]|nr:phage baseplate assembly protein V [Terriglobia bacterium]